jgi:hypothetical protein
MPHLLDEPLNFTICLAGNGYHGLFFEGPDDALERMFNFCLSYGLSNKCHKYKDNHYYTMAPLDRIKSCLLNCFRGEIVKDKEAQINYTTREIKDELGDTVEITVEWDEEKLNELASRKLETFFSRASNECLFEKTRKQFAPDFYEISPIDKK